jgi:hypothetical protein
MSSLIRKPSAVCALSLAGVALIAASTKTTATAAPVEYRGFEFYAAQTSFGGNTYTCDFSSLVGCAEVTIWADGDTSTIQPFSVPGASGYKNPVVTARVEAVVITSTNPLSDIVFDAQFTPSDQIYVSIDATNGGVGFGSEFGPTYPMGTYGGTPTIPYATYDLASDFSVSGFGPFCPTGTTYCSSLTALQTDHGDFAVRFAGPEFSDFSATVQPVVTMSEPWSVHVLAVAFGLLTLCRFRLAPQAPGTSRSCTRTQQHVANNG